MEFFRRIFGPRKEEEGERREEDIYARPAPPGKVIAVKPIMLAGEEEIEDVLREVKDGNVVVLRFDDYAKREPGKFEEVLRGLTRQVKEQGGETVMIDVKGIPPLLIVPWFIEVWRSPREKF